MLSFAFLFSVGATAALAASSAPHVGRHDVVHAGINIPPPPQNKDKEFFFNSSNAVSFSDAYFDYSAFDSSKLQELFGSSSSPGFGFNSARIQVNAKTALQRWYLDSAETAAPGFDATGALNDPIADGRGKEVKTELRSLLQSVFLRPEALFHLGRGTTGVPLFLTDETGRRYVTPLQTVEYVLSYTSGTGSRRAILNFCGTCTNCTDGNIPPPNLDNHGSGTIDDCPTYTKAMTNIIEYFSADRFRDDKIHFELFNEPHKGRIQDAKYRNCLLGVGKLAAERRGLESVIFPAAGWEDHAAVTYDWEEKAANDFPQFDIGWHIYPWTCPVRGRNWGGAGKNRLTDGGKNRLTDGGVCTVQQYEDWVLNEQELPMRGGKLPPRVWLTEFGASLYESGIDYFDPEGNGASPPNMHANDLKGIANVLGQTFAASCSQIRGLFFWHGGYFFDDSYTVNGGRKPDGKNGASFLKAVMADVNSESCADCTSYWGAGVCERERCSKCRVGVRASAEDDVEDSILAHALERDATVYEGETVYV